uniref:WD repeat-containing protein 70 n=1 Tax=Panthera onca TaxID=9690 RepID=UPI002954E121|nr:WD repeat-containing protein 70 [Panthera onca]
MERPGPSEVTGSDASGPDPQLAVTMGFTGFGKKARTFDLEAMFEQTRRTAVERSRKTLEAREKEEEMNREKELRRQNEDIEPTSSGSNVVRDCSKSSSRDTSSSESEESSGSSDDELIGPPLPLQMMKEPDNHIEEDIVGPLPPPLYEDAEDDDDDDGDSEEEENPVQKIPDSHEITLKHGTKTVSALGLDPSGARLVTGGYDYDVKFWDFAGMDASFKAFRSLQPCECLFFKGHTAMLHTGSWHPKIKGEFMTCSNDATVRTWEVENPRKQRSVFKPRTVQGKKVIPTTCTYSRDGNLIAAACQNGSIQIWDRNLIVHPKFHYKQAHDPGTDTSCVTFSYDGNVLASRGGDDTLKLWDIRQFNKPLFSASGLPTMFPMTDCCFSPDDKLVVTGTSVQRGCGSGKLVFFERRTFQRVYEIDITDASVVRCLWHPKLNQIMVGTGNGLAKVYYDPNKSQRGAKLCVVKTQRKAKQAETLTQDYIITPHALPMFREPRQRSTRKQLEKDRLDPLKSHKPEPPVAGPGRGGRVGTHGGTLSSYIVKNIALDKTDDSNPREAILRHAKAAEDNPYWVSPAYSKTQPKTMFAQVESDDEETKNEPEWKKRKI